ncbi:MAG: RES family NAD+ phosphorylase [Verrucomicrobiota bacterium]|nr:RES family NAD+ phosphorylase [Verrucomicrobiota bacterium]
MADVVVGWRIVKEKRARTAFTGEGASLYEGRWNSAGVRMVYCSENLALAALEILVHMQPLIPRDCFRAFRVTWSEKLMTNVTLRSLPAGWNAQPPKLASKKIGDGWIKRARTPVLALPSVIVPCERTFLLNPQHAAFSKIKIEDAGCFALDHRLR